MIISLIPLLIVIIIIIMSIGLIQYILTIRVKRGLDGLIMLNHIISATVGCINNLDKKALLKHRTFNNNDKRNLKARAYNQIWDLTTQQLRTKITPFISNIPSYIKSRIEDELDIRNNRIFT